MKRRVALLVSAVLILGLAFGLSFRQRVSATAPGVNQLVSQDSSGNYANSDSSPNGSSPLISGDGRYILFNSNATNLVSSDTNGQADIFERDSQGGATTLVSVPPAGGQFSYSTLPLALSYDGRYALFTSVYSPNQLFLRDVKSGTTTIVDNTTNFDHRVGADISADGRFVAFSGGFASPISGFNTNGRNQVYIKDMHTGVIKALSVDSSGNAGNQDSRLGPMSMSCDGDLVAFQSTASNLPGGGGVYIANIGWDTTELTQIGGGNRAEVSCNGNMAGFYNSSAYYEYNRLTGTSSAVSVGAGGLIWDHSSIHLGSYSMSDDGRYIAFITDDPGADTAYPTTGAGSLYDAYVRDTKKGITQLVSFTAIGNRSGWVPGSVNVRMIPAISADGSMVAYPYTTPSSANTSEELISGLNTGTGTSQVDIYESETGF